MKLAKSYIKTCHSCCTAAKKTCIWQLITLGPINRAKKLKIQASNDRDIFETPNTYT